MSGCKISWELNCFPILQPGWCPWICVCCFYFIRILSWDSLPLNAPPFGRIFCLDVFFPSMNQTSKSKVKIPYQRWGWPFPKEFRNLVDHPNSRKVPISQCLVQLVLISCTCSSWSTTNVVVWMTTEIFWKTEIPCFNNSGHSITYIRGIKRYKCVVILSNLPVIMHCWGW